MKRNAIGTPLWSNVDMEYTDDEDLQDYHGLNMDEIDGNVFDVNVLTNDKDGQIDEENRNLVEQINTNQKQSNESNNHNNNENNDNNELMDLDNEQNEHLKNKKEEAEKREEVKIDVRKAVCKDSQSTKRKKAK